MDIDMTGDGKPGAAADPFGARAAHSAEAMEAEMTELPARQRGDMWAGSGDMTPEMARALDTQGGRDSTHYQDKLRATGQQVIGIEDDAAVPLVGTVVGWLDDERCQVDWGDGAGRPMTENMDELTTYGRQGAEREAGG